MNLTSISDLAKMAGGRLISGDPGKLVGRVSTDSRQIMPGDLFIALQGENHDAHSFLTKVSQAGAAAILVHRKVESPSAIIEVEDTLVGLQALARSYRQTLKCKVIGITGSNGKTSTKDFTAAVLSSDGRVTKTAGNLNNHIGLPLSILTIDDESAYAVLEMGMNHAGEIAPLARIAVPEIAIITNIGVAHIEHLKTQDAIAREKGELAVAISSQGTVILNANDRYTLEISKRCDAKILTAGVEAGDVSGTHLFTEAGGTRFTVTYKKQTANAFLPVPGRHMVENALLAISVGVACGLSLAEAAVALENIELSKGRLEIKNIGGIVFLDDTYNANPDSMIAALATLVAMPEGGRRIAVLGAMGELGTYAEEGHRQVGKAAKEIDLLLTVGQSAEWIAEEAEISSSAQVIRAADTAQAVAVLLHWLTPGDCVLVKGSRSARMELVIQGVAESLSTAATT